MNQQLENIVDLDSNFDANADPEKRQKAFDKIVEKALEGYPPKK